MEEKQIKEAEEGLALPRSALGCMLSANAAGILILGGVLAALGYFVQEIPSWLKLPAEVVFVLYCAWVLISSLIRYNSYGYSIQPDKLLVREGLIFTKTDMVPVERIHQITVKSGPIERLYGLSKVIVTTAGGEVTIRFLKEETAWEIADSLQKIVGKARKAQTEEPEALDGKGPQEAFLSKQGGESHG